MIRIFISSVQSEFTGERAALRDYLREDNLMRRFFEVFLFEDVPATDRRPDDLYLDEVEQCDLYVGLLGAAYGSEDGEGISPTEREFDQATKLGKHRLIFVKGAGKDERHPKMQALIRKAESALVRKRFQTVEELRASLYAALIGYLEAHGVLRTGPFDAALCPGATMDDLDSDRMALFLRTARRVRKFPLPEDTPPAVLLDHLGLRRDERLTNAAVLLFGKDPQRFLYSSGVTCAHFHGRDVAKPIPAHRRFNGNLFDLADQATDFVLSKIALHVGTREDSVRAPRTYEIPEGAITEAIVNAIAHRDYTTNDSVQVMLFADRLLVMNSGTLPPGLTIAELKRPHRSIARNPLITTPLYLNGTIERTGTGTLDMTSLCLSAGLSGPEFASSGGFEVTIRRATLAGRNGIRSVVVARCGAAPVTDVELMALFPDKTWKRAITDEDGMASIELHSTHLPMTVFAARDGFRACVHEGWIPDDGSLHLALEPLSGGGSVIFFDATGPVPGLSGWINPIRDPLDRTYLYTFNIAVDGGKPQPVPFTPGDELRLTDAEGQERTIRVIAIQGRSALVEYRAPDTGEPATGPS